MKESVLKLLKQYSFITNYEQYEVDNKKFLKVHLKEVHDKIQDVPVIKFYSKPSRRWYI
ncbi:30S ribosomal protein S8 [bacterium]|nr:30S ribosomal protein S8 [bacterium]